MWSTDQARIALREFEQAVDSCKMLEGGPKNHYMIIFRLCELFQQKLSEMSLHRIQI